MTASLQLAGYQRLNAGVWAAGFTCRRCLEAVSGWHQKLLFRAPGPPLLLSLPVVVLQLVWWQLQECQGTSQDRAGSSVGLQSELLPQFVVLLCLWQCEEEKWSWLSSWCGIKQRLFSETALFPVLIPLKGWWSGITQDCGWCFWLLCMWAWMEAALLATVFYGSKNCSSGLHFPHKHCNKVFVFFVECDKGETDEVNTTAEWHHWSFTSSEACNELY